jgi:hypothetical protein
MKINQTLVGFMAGIITFSIATTTRAGGTDILHLSLQKMMANTGVETNATGRIALTQNVQGHTDKQLLSLQIAGLTSNSTYILFAGILDTNLTAVTNFSTDGNGSATLQYGAPGKSKSKNNTPVPDVLNPLRDIRTVAVGTIVTNILSLDTNVVLVADLSAAEKFQYLVKRNISTNSVSTNIRIKASDTQAQFQLMASPLSASTNYIFAVNDAFEAIATSDSKGRLKFAVNPDPTQILSVHSVALWDNASNVVVRTTLP